MAKLYPPVLAGTIPAFGGTSIIEVPFSMSRAVSVNEVFGLALKIKKINGTVIDTVKISWRGNLSLTEDRTAVSNFHTARFSVGHCNLALGEYYKLQLAYIDLNNEIGYFSTVGVVKCTSIPYVAIDGLQTTCSNSHNYIYTGVCRQASPGADDTDGYDTSEKLYSSRFYLYDENGKVIKDTGEILHNAHGDVSPYEATDTFEFYDDFELDKSYFIQYVATTSNGLVASSPRYKIYQRRLRPMVLQAHLEVKNDFDAGVVQVNLVQDVDELASGLFLLTRASSKTPNKWESMKEFSLQSEYPNRVLYKDYTVEQGITYRYSLQQYNTHGVYSERRISNEVIADFEDLFLYDGNRQLAVRFNPKVSTFKENKIEQKTETIGSKYPFIIRNGAVAYKELAISGLISYQMDAIEQFMSKDALDFPLNSFDRKRYDLRDLVADNVKAERLFKTEVLDWLNNGGIKLYRSPTEGNFVVRLMNVTTTPTDQLGRMLHTFNCTAYEIAPPNYDSLIQYGILEPELNAPSAMRWKTVELREIAQSNKNSEHPQDFIQLNYGNTLGAETMMNVYSLDFQDMAPGSYFLVGLSPEDAKKIFIGATSSYHFVSDEPIQYVAVPAKLNNQFIEYEGSLTFGYQGWVKSSFDLISEVNILDEAGKRFIGNAYSIDGSSNILEYLTDIKRSVLAIKYIKLYPRELHTVYYNENENLYYLTEEDQAHGGIPYDSDQIIQKLNILNIYKVRKTRSDYYDINNEDYYLDVSDRETPGQIYIGKYYVYLDPYRYYWKKIHNKLTGDRSGVEECRILSSADTELYNVNIDDNTINMYDVFYRNYHSLEDIFSISIGAGVILDMGYQMQQSVYDFEASDLALREQNKVLNRLLKDYTRNRQTIGSFDESVNRSLAEYYQKEEIYLHVLANKIETYKQENHLQ